MNILKTTPVGVDNPIQALQTYLYNELLETWTLTESNSLFTGRCYKNKTEDGFIPEMFLGNNEYKELLLDDTKKAQMFFVVSDKVRFNSPEQYKTDCGIIFIVNANEIYPTGRLDEEIRRDVLLLIRDRFGFITVSEIITGIDNVFREFMGWRIKNGIKYNDMNPFHVFRINVEITYSITNC